jgi:hypothetical protein
VVAHSVSSTVAGVGPSPFRVGIGGGVLVVAVLLAGCSSETWTHTAATTTTQPPGASTTASAVAGPSTTSSRSAAEAAVLAAYRAYWGDIIAAGRTADWRSPRLDDHATGAALAAVRGHYRALKTLGLVSRGTVKLDPRVVELRGTTALVEDCTDTSRFLRRDAETGALRERPAAEPTGSVMRLVLVDGTWKVAKATRKAEVCAG